MKHISVKAQSPIEFVNITPLNPLISHCQIKVCYVSDEPNRNKSVITKDVARQMANSLPGSPIVGYFNTDVEDYEEHNRILNITENGKITLEDETRPYGFVDLGAKVWFQKFIDDGVEHEYLMTEGYLWTGQYPEAQRVIDKGNNQSMELDEKTIKAFWTKDSKGNPEFFIINEAIISKLCILGEDWEPCFEGAGIAQEYVQFSLGDDLKNQMYSLIEQMKEILNEGGSPVIVKYAVEIGDALWESLYEYSVKNEYSIIGVYTEEDQKFAILQGQNDVFYRLNFSINDDEGFVPVEELIEIETHTDEPHFSAEEVAEYAAKKKKSEEEEEKEDKKPEDTEEKKPEDDDEEEEKKKKKYNLEEVVEYAELQTSYSELNSKYEELETKYNNLVSENAALTEFKNGVELQKKQEMIDSFYMLSDEDKKDVIENINTYSIDDIEAKLAIICVRNKVSFSLDDDHDDKGNEGNPTVYNVGNDSLEDETVPAWVKSLQATADKMK